MYLSFYTVSLANRCESGTTNITHASSLLKYPRAREGDLIYSSPSSPIFAKLPSSLTTRTVTPGTICPALPRVPIFWSPRGNATIAVVSVIPTDKILIFGITPDENSRTISLSQFNVREILCYSESQFCRQGCSSAHYRAKRAQIVLLYFRALYDVQMKLDSLSENQQKNRTLPSNTIIGGTRLVVTVSMNYRTRA